MQSLFSRSAIARGTAGTFPLLTTLLAILISFLALPQSVMAGSEPRVALARNASLPRVMQSARLTGRVAAGTRIKLAISLPLRDPDGLNDLLRRLYDPHDSLYHHFLTQPEFTRRFAPSQSDYDALIAFVQSQGLTVTHADKSRTLLSIAGSREAVEAAFQTQLNTYRLADGRAVYANASVPTVPQSIASRISSVVGLSNANLYLRPHHHILPRQSLQPMIQAGPFATPNIGSGPAGALTPSDIKTAYSLLDAAPTDLSGLTGTGQVLGLYELDGYLDSDIRYYANYFGLGSPQLKNFPTSTFDGKVGDASVEVVLDIEMMLALAPKATIYVYEGENGTTDLFDLYQTIATDNIAKSISTSFGNDEGTIVSDEAATKTDEITPTTNAFKQMATQGQSFFAAAGDSGAYDDGKKLSVDYPASNPYVTGVGGTALTTSSTQEYISETTWSNTTPDDRSQFGSGGGGGISSLFAIPTYQSSITGASTSMRNVPDVSLDSAPRTGYAVYFTDPDTEVAGFGTIGGTSAAAPLWAAFTGLANEQRARFSASNTVGFINPFLYNLAKTSSYSTVFHDIADGSTNLKYAAKVGYDNATGLGTFIGDQLLTALLPAASSPQTLMGTVQNGKGVSDVTITITSPQLPNLNLSPTYDKTTGTFSQALESSITVDAATQSLSYDVSVEAPNKAGDAKNVTLTDTQQVTLTLSPSDHTFTSNALEMVSAPYDYTATGDFAALFGLKKLPLSTGGNLVAYSPTQGQYLYYPQAPADTFRRGQGYWARFPQAAYIRRRGIAGSSEQSYRISLQQGWNQIGDPFLKSVLVSRFQVAELATVTTPNPTATSIGSSGLVALPLYGYDPATTTSANPYTKLNADSAIQPWQGYWIYATQPAVLIIPAS